MKCPKCKSGNVIKYGRYGDAQTYYCKDCRKRFRDKGLKEKTYSPHVITSAITHYNLGSTLEESARYVNRRFKVKISKSSVHSWVKEFSDICTYRKLRSQVVKKYLGDIIFAFSFQHSGLTYNFRYHLPKLELLCSSYPSLIQFLRDMERRCPSDIFKENKRCSQIKLDAVKFKKQGRYNQACKLAGLALKACDKNKERHNKVEEFMLINDSSTIACELPVWFWDKNLDIGVCGHVDILQVRQGKVFVLDFKPDACKEMEQKVASQLYLYAQGLSFRTGIPLNRFRCAWFDENVYYEFNPRDIKAGIKNKYHKEKEHITLAA